MKETLIRENTGEFGGLFSKLSQKFFVFCDFFCKNTTTPLLFAKWSTQLFGIYFTGIPIGLALMKADFFAFGAIVLWASLATIATLLSEIPPFLLTGIGLVIGSLISLPLSGFKLSAWKVPGKTLAVGVYGLFGFHLMLFIALQTAPPVEANLVNYLWPLLLVILAPLFSRHLKLGPRHTIAASAGFTGAAIAITSAGGVGGVLGFQVGYLFALAAAVIWATYSLMTTKLPAFPTSAIGLFGLVSGVLAIAAHFVLEDPAVISGSDWVLLVIMGLGPLGGAFYFWDAALKIGDPRRIGLLAFLTPLLSTTLLLVVSSRALSWQLLIATALIVGGAVLGSRSTREPKPTS
jgi:drug/metabolite transporter (DMT)-like permease